MGGGVVGLAVGVEADFVGVGAGLAEALLRCGDGDAERFDELLPLPDPLPDPLPEPVPEPLLLELEIGPQKMLSGSTCRLALGAVGSNGEHAFDASA